MDKRRSVCTLSAPVLQRFRAERRPGSPAGSAKSEAPEPPNRPSREHLQEGHCATCEEGFTRPRTRARPVPLRMVRVSPAQSLSTLSSGGQPKPRKRLGRSSGPAACPGVARWDATTSPAQRPGADARGSTRPSPCGSSRVSSRWNSGWRTLVLAKHGLAQRPDQRRQALTVGADHDVLAVVQGRVGLQPAGPSRPAAGPSRTRSSGRPGRDAHGAKCQAAAAPDQPPPITATLAFMSALTSAAAPAGDPGDPDLAHRRERDALMQDLELRCARPRAARCGDVGHHDARQLGFGQRPAAANASCHRAHGPAWPGNASGSRNGRCSPKGLPA